MQHAVDAVAHTQTVGPQASKMNVARSGTQGFQDEEVDELDDGRLVGQRAQIVDLVLLLGQHHDVGTRAGIVTALASRVISSEAERT